MATVSLQMIVKDEFDEVSTLIAKAEPFFDEINLTVSDKPTANKLQALTKKYPIMTVKWREWNDRFDDARNDNFAMCNSDFAFWVDSDDDFDFSVIPGMVDLAEENDIDAVFLPYNYAQDERGNCITRHWRERLIRMGIGFEWRGWVHETCINDNDHTTHKLDNGVKHLSNKDPIESAKRNHKILEKAYAETKDPRYLHYLGMSNFTFRNYNKAAELLSEYLNVGGSVEDSYRALAALSECAYFLDQHDLALEYASKAMTLKPEYPMAYWLMAQFEEDQGNYEEALEWIRTSEAKPDPQTLSVWDPTSRERAKLIAAHCEFMLKRYNRALAWLKKIPHNKTAQEQYDVFLDEADAETFTQLIPKFRKFFASDKALWEALCNDIKYDARIRPLRQMVEKPKTWDDKSIVIFCGEGYEEWGPHTLDKGMGGSEEAVVYLSRELAKLGWDVTVFGEADLDDDVFGVKGANSVHYRHWKKIDIRDTFNVFIAWRSPQYLKAVDAKVKLADIHDVMPEEIMEDLPGVTYMVKSDYHRGLSPHLPDDKFRVIGNGIKKEQFGDDK